MKDYTDIQLSSITSGMLKCSEIRAVSAIELMFVNPAVLTHNSTSSSWFHMLIHQVILSAVAPLHTLRHLSSLERPKWTIAK